MEEAMMMICRVESTRVKGVEFRRPGIPSSDQGNTSKVQAQTMGRERQLCGGAALGLVQACRPRNWG